MAPVAGSISGIWILLARLMLIYRPHRGAFCQNETRPHVLYSTVVRSIITRFWVRGAIVSLARLWGKVLRCDCLLVCFVRGGEID